VYGFKPRLVLEDGRLRLVPLPTLAYDHLAALFDPAHFLGHEDFLHPYRPVRFRFPYVDSLLRALDKEQARRWLSGVPSTGIAPSTQSGMGVLRADVRV
jgi:hypothetical protein